jgi:hypothetical protein
MAEYFHALAGSSCFRRSVIAMGLLPVWGELPSEEHPQLTLMPVLA